MNGRRVFGVKCQSTVFFGAVTFDIFDEVAISVCNVYVMYFYLGPNVKKHNWKFNYKHIHLTG